MSKFDTTSDISNVYNRLQESHRAIGELVELLSEFRHINDNRDQHSDDYLDGLDTRILNAIEKYGDVNGD